MIVNHFSKHYRKTANLKSLTQVNLINTLRNTTDVCRNIHSI